MRNIDIATDTEPLIASSQSEYVKYICNKMFYIFWYLFLIIVIFTTIFVYVDSFIIGGIYFGGISSVILGMILLLISLFLMITHLRNYYILFLICTMFGYIIFNSGLIMLLISNFNVAIIIILAFMSIIFALIPFLYACYRCKKWIDN